MTAVALIVLLMPSAGYLAFADPDGGGILSGPSGQVDGVDKGSGAGGSAHPEGGEGEGEGSGSPSRTGQDRTAPADSDPAAVKAGEVHFELKPRSGSDKLDDIRRVAGGEVYYKADVVIVATVYVPKDKAGSQGDEGSFIKGIVVKTEGATDEANGADGWVGHTEDSDVVKDAQGNEYCPFTLDVTFSDEMQYANALSVAVPAASGEDGDGATELKTFAYEYRAGKESAGIAGFTVDKTAPAVTFDIPQDALLEEEGNVQTYLQGTKWTATVADANLDAAKAKAYDAAAGTKKDDLDNLDASWTLNENGTSASAEFELEDGTEILSYVVVEDRAGNITKAAYQGTGSKGMRIKAAADDEAPSAALMLAGTRVEGVQLAGRDCFSALAEATVTASNIDSLQQATLVFARTDDAAADQKTFQLDWTSDAQDLEDDYTGPYTASVDLGDANALADGSYSVTLTVGTGGGNTLTYAYGGDESPDALALDAYVGSTEGAALAGKGLVLDTTAPVIADIAWSEEPIAGTGPRGPRRYSADALKATITVTDANIEASGLGVTFGPSQDAAVSDAGSWEQDAEDATKWTRTITFKPETVQTEFTVTAKDVFGNEASRGSGTFEVDSKSPDISFVHSANAGEDGTLLFGDANATVTVTVTDAHFDAGSSTVTVYTETGATGDGHSGFEWKWDAASATATCEVALAEGDQSIRVVANDSFGNSEAVEVLDKIVCDRTEPAVSVTFPDKVMSASQEDASFLEGVVDFFTSLLPGADNVSVTVTDANFDPDHTTYTWGDENGTVVETGTWSTAWTQGEQAGEWTNTLSLPEGSDSSYRTLVVTATDLAGNTKSDVSYAGTTTDRPDSKFVAQDTTAPEISIKMSTKPAGAEGSSDVYGTAVQAVVTVTDTFFDPAASTVVATGQANVTGSAWRHRSGTSEWVATLRFVESSGNTITVTAADLVGNTSEASYADAVYDDGGTQKQVTRGSFSVDTSGPSVFISMDRAVVRTDAETGIDYYNDDVTATITIVEPRLDRARTSVLVNDTDQSRSLRLRTGTTGTYELQVPFTSENSADGAYTVSVVAVDTSARQATLAYGDEGVLADDVQTAGQGFVVDKTKPVVSISLDKEVAGTETQDGSPYTDYYNEEVTATVTVVDRNFSPSSTTVYVNGAALTEELEPVPDTADTYSISRTFGDESENVTINVSTEDKAAWTSSIAYGDAGDSNGAGKGVTASGTQVAGKNFTVDTTCPVISMSIDRTVARTVDGTDFFNNDVVLTVTVVEKHLRDQTVMLGDSSERTLAKRPGSDDTWTVQIPFGESDDNTVSVALTDWATWTATMQYGDQADSNGGGSGTRAGRIQAGGTKFTVDKTAAELVSVVFDKEISVAAKTGDNTTDVDYFTEETTATVTVRDKYFDSANTAITAQGGTVVASDGTVWHQDESEGDVWSARVRFGEGAGKSLEFVLRDFAGNSASAAARGRAEDSAGKLLTGETFAVDCTNPLVASVRLDQALSNSVDNVDYFKSVTDGVLTATITVRDVNFNPSKSLVYRDNAEQASPWRQSTSDAELWTATLQYGEGANHSFSLSLVDYAGHTCAYGYGEGRDSNGVTTPTLDQDGKELANRSFTIDVTDPVISISFAKKVARRDADFQTDYFNKANSNGLLVATVSVNDVNFWNDDRGYAFETDGTVVSANGVVWTSGGTQGNATTWTARVTFKEGANHTLSVRMTDKARNSASYAYGRGTRTTDSKGTKLDNPKFTLDLTAPKLPSASTTKDESGNYKDKYLFYKDKTTVKLKVTDNVGMLSLKLEDKNYKIGNIDKFKAGSKSFTAKIKLSDKAEFDRDIVLTVTDLANNNRTWTLARNGTIKVGGSTSKASNESISKDDVHPRAAVQDTVDPKLVLSGVSAGTYYTSGRTLGVDITEKNFKYVKTYDPSQTIVSITFRAGEAGASAKVTEVPASKFNKTAKGKYHCDIPLTKEGHYSVSAQVTDPAGNKVSKKIGRFSIDKSAPTVSVTFNNNDSLNGMYYRASRVATITVREHNFDAGRLNVSTSGSKGSWSTSGDVHTMTVSYTSDGRYELNVSGSDAAGNTMSPYASGTFVIDTTAPRIEFRNIKKNRAYNGTVSPTIAFIDDANFNSNGTSYTLKGNKVGKASYETSTAEIGNGEELVFADFEHEAEVDDIYTLKASMEDLAGNEASGSITFSVNRFGSTFRVVDEEEYQNGYLPEARTVEIEEINVSGCKPSNHTAAVTRGRDTTMLERHKDAQETGYTVEGDENGDEWSVYRYSVAAGNFEEDGEYRVDVLSKDTAGNRNRMSNYYDSEDAEAVADATVSFVIDREAPVIIGLNVEEGQVYEEPSKVVRYAINDNIRIKNASLELDDEVVEPTQTSAGNYEIEVPAAAFTSHKLNIVASDYANQKLERGINQFWVTTDFFELHLPVFIALVVGALIIAAGAAFLIIRGRRAARAKQDW